MLIKDLCNSNKKSYTQISNSYQKILMTWAQAHQLFKNPLPVEWLRESSKVVKISPKKPKLFMFIFSDSLWIDMSN